MVGLEDSSRMNSLPLVVYESTVKTADWAAYLGLVTPETLN